MKKEQFHVICSDGVRLNGILLIPEIPKAVIQFNCGTGAKKEVYLPLLTYLAEHNYACCLWDYRGSGDSAPSTLKGCDYAYSDYGIKDMPAIKDYLNKRFGDMPFFIVAHSAGGQQIGFMNNLDNIRGVVNIAVSAGYYPNMPWKYRLKAYTYFYLFTPISVLFTGYVNGKKLGFMEDLPKNVVYQWRAWCAKPDYFFDKKFLEKTIPTGNFKNFNFPIHVFWTADDNISNQKNTENFWKHIHSNKGINFERITPDQFSLKRIGHFGFFKRAMKDKFWGSVVRTLDTFFKASNDLT